MRLAVLIDAENVSHRLIEPILGEIATLGTVAVKRVYGDFTIEQARVWQAVALRHAIQPVQQYQFTKGKNSSDFALVIDAMDLLHAGLIDGFCLVSSDSDFTRLAMRLREAGKQVFGFGDPKTPAALVVACDRFFSTDNLKPAAAAATSPAPGSTVRGGRTPAAPEPSPIAVESAQRPVDKLSLAELAKLIDAIVDDLKDTEGRAVLAVVGSRLQQQRPEFDARSYGHRKLGDLLDALPGFSIKRTAIVNGGTLVTVERPR